MPSLQIQDAFEPYYAEVPASRDRNRKEASPAAPGLTTAEVRARLENCRLRLARAIVATASERG